MHKHTHSAPARLHAFAFAFESSSTYLQLEKVSARRRAAQTVALSAHTAACRGKYLPRTVKKARCSGEISHSAAAPPTFNHLPRSIYLQLAKAIVRRPEA